MTDQPIPDDLLDRLEGAVRHADEIPNILTALAEWADGALIDPATWTRVTATETDEDERCTAHNTSFDGWLGRCFNSPRLTDQDGWESCTPVPLYTLTPRETP